MGFQPRSHTLHGAWSFCLSITPYVHCSFIFCCMFIFYQTYNGGDYYYYVIIYAYTYMIAVSFTPRLRLSICLFSLIVLKYHLLYSYGRVKLDHIVSMLSDNPQCPWFHPIFDEVASFFLWCSNSINNSRLLLFSPTNIHHSSPPMVLTPTD